MKKIFTIAILALTINAFAQKVNKTYWGYSNNVHEEFQVNSLGLKDGYYKEFYKEGQLYISGFYKSGQKSGLWTTYDMNWSGQISSTMEYENDKMNGQYKQWCWEKSKRYLCGDYIYKDGLEISAIKYYSNGKKSSQNDANGYFEWFEDGTPGVETKNGKTYKYQMFSADYYHNTEKKEIRCIAFDSIGIRYEYTYDYDTKLDGEHLKVKKLNISVWDIETKGEKIYYRFNFYDDGLIHGLNDSGQEIILDSASVRNGYYLFKNEPTNYFDKFDGVYDIATGDFKIIFNDGSYEIIHYFNKGNEVIYSIKEYDNLSKLIGESKKENEEIKNKNIKKAEEEFLQFYNNYCKSVYDSLSAFNSFFWEHYKPQVNQYSSDGYNYPPCHPIKDIYKSNTCKYCIYCDDYGINNYFNNDEIDIVQSQNKFYSNIDRIYYKMRNSTPQKAQFISEINPSQFEYENNKTLYKNKFTLQDNGIKINELNKQFKKKVLFKKYTQVQNEMMLYINDKNNSLNDRKSKSNELVLISNKVITLFNQDTTELENQLKDAETVEQIKTIILNQ